MGRACNQNEKAKYPFKILTGETMRKRPLERPRRKLEDNIRMDLEEVCPYEELRRFASGLGLLEKL